jgi:hypothetical protein
VDLHDVLRIPRRDAPRDEDRREHVVEVLRHVGRVHHEVATVEGGELDRAAIVAEPPLPGRRDHERVGQERAE